MQLGKDTRVLPRSSRSEAKRARSGSASRFGWFRSGVADPPPVADATNGSSYGTSWLSGAPAAERCGPPLAPPPSNLRSIRLGSAFRVAVGFPNDRAARGFLSGTARGEVIPDGFHSLEFAILAPCRPPFEWVIGSPDGSLPQHPHGASGGGTN